MSCEAARTDLLDFSNGETGPLHSWAIRRHLARCAGCADELATLERLTLTLRRADLVPPEAAPLPLPRRLPLRRALAATAAALFAGGLLLLPTLDQNRRNAQNPGAAVAAALGRVNTWHFSGWKLIDGKQVPWEVWGRRVPWLYYERVGDTITWSDSKQRLRVFAPDAALNRPHGLIIKTSGDQVSGDLGFLGDPAYQSLVNSQRARADFGDGATKVYAQTLTVAHFRSQDAAAGPISGVNTNKLYTISKRDWLPTLYQRHFDGRTFARDTEYLGVRYDVDLPDAILLPPSTDGYSVVDFTPSAKHADGFKVDVQPVGMDATGNVVLVARGWLGEDRLTPGSALSLDVQPYNGSVSGERRGQAIKYLYATNSSLPPGRDIYMPFTPLEPSQVARALPDTLSLSMNATPQIQVRSSDELDANGGARPVTRTESLIDQSFHWRLPLPRPVPNLAAALPPDARSLFNSLNARERYSRRRVYYSSSWDFQAKFYEKVLPEATLRKFRSPDGSLDYYRINASLPPQQLDALQHEHAAEYKMLEQGFRRRAIYWQRQQIALLKGKQNLPPSQRNIPVNFLRQDDTFLLAKLYRDGGDKTGMRRTLRQLIADTQADSSLGQLHRQAEYMLGTGQYPTDFGYKGPA